MGKVAFIQKNWFEVHGPMCIAAVLKQNGHAAGMFIEPGEKDLISKLKAFGPDVLAFSLVTEEYPWAVKLASKLKKVFAVPVIFGGIHPTFCPEESLGQDCVDAVCRGEGEYAMLEFLNGLDKNKRMPVDVANLWVKDGGRIVRNPVRPLVADLDSMPQADRGIYYLNYPSLREYPIKKFASGRGCPYDCSYCCNKGLKLLYKDKGRMLRRRSPDNLIAELKSVKEQWKLRMVEFIDDEFAYDRKWLAEFLHKYKGEIGIPFSCLARIDLIDEEQIKLLKWAGCIALHFGIESGNERIRKEILYKNISNDIIIEKAGLLKKHRLKFNTYNMLNIPGETIEEGLETVRLNARIKADYPWCSVLQPYPGTQMWERVFGARGCGVRGSMEQSFHESSPIQQPDSDKLENLQKFFYIAVKMPWALGLIKRLINLAPNGVYNFIFLATFGYRHMRANHLSLAESVRFNFRHVGNYFRRGE